MQYTLWFQAAVIQWKQHFPSSYKEVFVHTDRDSLETSMGV